jgi:organic radical activating enzyme
MSEIKKEERIPAIHNFYNKLRQQSVFPQLIRYVKFQKEIQRNMDEMMENPNIAFHPITESPPPYLNSQQKDTLSNNLYNGSVAPISLISVNLDITTACNHTCIFCVDNEVINNGQILTCAEVFKTIDTLAKNGLRSIIIIGGGEPTLHPDFKDIVNYIKGREIQVGIVSNGTQSQKILDIVPLLCRNDYIRFSIDAGVDSTYQEIHNPKGKGNSLTEVLCLAKKIKLENPVISLGYSFVICWDDTIVNGKRVPRNIEEIPLAYQNCLDHNFDYLSLKPCLVKKPEKPVETLCDAIQEDCKSNICLDIEKQIQLAEQNINENIPIVQSVNLRGLLKNNLARLRSQPRICHAGFFRQVITPMGIYHCPAYRGSEIARIGDSLGYTSQKSANLSYMKTTELLMRFDAGLGCKDIACFYNEFNHSIQKLIDSDEDFCKIESIPDQDFFF